MRRELIKFVLCLFFFPNIMVIGQHRPIYSNYLQNGIIYNPAFTGSAGALSLSLSSRFQWTGIEDAPQTHTFTAHAPLPVKVISTGLIVSYDKFGPSVNSDVFNTYSLRFQFKKVKIALGALIGFTQVSTNYTRATLNNEGDPSFSQNIQEVVPKTGAGIHVQYRNFFGGFSIPSISLRKSSTINNSFFFNQQFIYGGYTIKLGENLTLMPSLYFKNLSSSGNQVDINLLTSFLKRFTAGISYRHQDAFVGILNVKVNNQLYLGYSYDYLLSNLSTVSKGNQEVFIRYDFKYLINDISIKKFR